MRPETLKARLKAEMVWGSLVRGRFKESLQVGEKDVAAAAQQGGRVDAGRVRSNTRLRPIVLIVPRGSASVAVDRVAQGSGKPARAGEELRRGELLLQVDAERRDPRHRHQDLGRHPGPLRELLDKTPIGH